MRRFQFRLGTLLRLRRVVRDERRAQLAEAFRIADALQTQLSQLDAELARTRQGELSPGPTVNVDRLLDANRYGSMLRAQRALLERQSAQVATEIEKRREALVAADRDVKALEMLEESKAEQHRAFEERQATKELDETAARAATNRVQC